MKFSRASSLPATLLATACAFSCGWGQSSSTPSKTTTTATTRTSPTPEQLRFRAFVDSRRKFVEGLKPTDDCTRLLKAVESGQVKLDNTDLRSLTRSVLKELNVPLSSQLLVFSGSASQGTKVNPRNPRAIYFNDECYVGIVPGGLLEMIGVDAAAGATLYTFQQVGTRKAPTAIANDGCTRCHGSVESGYAPGFFMRFCLPEMSGKMTSLINAVEGHERPLEDRFGGWFVTSIDERPYPSAGMIMKEGVAVRTRIGEHFDPGMHLSNGSDILAHLLHEHQIGFHNRLIKTLMSARDNGLAEGTRMLPSHEEDVDEMIRYLLFRGEAALPAGGVIGHPRYIEDFRKNRRPSRTGASLKDLDLKTRLLKYRCSYMIYTRPWLEMPAEIKAELITRLHRALQSSDDPLSDHLPEFERLQILRVLRDTLPGLPEDW